MSALSQYVAPLLMAGLALWAGWLAFAAEADTDLPRMLAGHIREEHGELSLARQLHVAHLALLALAGVAAGLAVAWWLRSPAAGLMRLLIAACLLWAVGDLLPRFLATHHQQHRRFGGITIGEIYDLLTRLGFKPLWRRPPKKRKKKGK